MPHRTITKATIAKTGTAVLNLKEGTEIIGAGLRSNDIELWMFTEIADVPLQTRTFLVLDTGATIPDDTYSYIAHVDSVADNPTNQTHIFEVQV